MKRLLTIILLLLPMMAGAQQFDRGIRKSVFVPKGQWMVGGAFSYSQVDLTDYKFLVIDDLNATGYTLSLSPFFGYFIADNLALGARFTYQRTLGNLDEAGLDLGEDLSMDIKDFYMLQHKYLGTLMMRNYINIGESKRFGFFNEIRLSAGGGQGKVLSGKDDSFTGTYQDIAQVQIGMSPGMAAFITNNVAVDLSVGVLGFNYKHIHQITDQTVEGDLRTSSANFKIDIFSINIGMAVYIPSMNPWSKKYSKKFRYANN